MSDLTSWITAAACCEADVDPEWFFPHSPPQGISWEQSAALKICARCPVLLPCRAACDVEEDNLGPQSIHGIRGGETPRDRMRRRNVKVRGMNTLRYIDSGVRR